MQHAQLRRHGDLMQNSINPITNAQVILERLNMDVRRPFENCLANDLVNEFDYGRFGVVGVQLVRGFAFLKHFEGAVAFQDFIERLCADPVERFHCAQKLCPRH